MHSFCKDLLSAYYGPDTPLGAEDDTDTNPGQAAANNYGKLVRCQMGVGAREEGKTGDKVRAILGCSRLCSLQIQNDRLLCAITSRT